MKELNLSAGRKVTLRNGEHAEMRGRGNNMSYPYLMHYDNYTYDVNGRGEIMVGIESDFDVVSDTVDGDSYDSHAEWGRGFSHEYLNRPGTQGVLNRNKALSAGHKVEKLRDGWDIVAGTPVAALGADATQVTSVSSATADHGKFTSEYLNDEGMYGSTNRREARDAGHLVVEHPSDGWYIAARSALVDRYGHHVGSCMSLDMDKTCNHASPNPIMGRLALDDIQRHAIKWAARDDKGGCFANTSEGESGYKFLTLPTSDDKG